MSNTRIGRRFAEVKEKNQSALAASITAGDPSLVAALERGDKDIDIYRENLKDLDE